MKNFFEDEPHVFPDKMPFYQRQARWDFATFLSVFLTCSTALPNFNWAQLAGIHLMLKVKVIHIILILFMTTVKINLF